MAENAQKTLTLNIEGDASGLDKTLKQAAQNIQKFQATLSQMTSEEKTTLAGTSKKKYAQYQKWATTGKTAETRQKYSEILAKVDAARYYAKTAGFEREFVGSGFDARGEAPKRYPIDSKALALADRIGNAVGSQFPDTSSASGEQSGGFAKLSSKIAVAKAALAEFAKKAAPFIAAAKKIGTVVKKVATTFGKFAVKVGRAAANFVKSKINIGKLSKSLQTLRRAFARVVTYKAIREFLSLINSGLTNGINNLYKFSSLLEGRFKSTMDSFATSANYVQNAIGAFAGTILNALMPAINSLLDKLAEAINTFTKFSASLLGTGYYQATKAAKTYADMVGTAASNQRQLLGFDELNVLSSTDGDVSGSFGSYDQFAEGFDNIDEAIDRVTEKLNSFVESIDMKSIATKVAQKVNTVADKFNTLMDGINFESMGVKLSDGMNTLVENVDPDELGKVLTQKINMVIDLAKGFVENFNWSAAGAWLSNLVSSWFDSIKWDNLTSVISKAINGIFEFVKSFVTNTDWPAKAKHLAELLNGLVDKIDWDNVGSTINTCIQTLIDVATEFIQNVDWKALGTKIYDAMSEIEWGTIFSKMGELIKSALAGMFQTIFSYISTRWNEKRIEFAQSRSSWDIAPAEEKAVGGTVSTGSLFLAGEAGPELVTSMNGRSTVYNEQQLGNSLAYANENVVSAINTLIGVVRSKSNSVTISASDIRKAVNNSSMRLGV